MLQRVLRLMAEGESLSTTSLARGLDVSEGLVEHMLSQMVSLGLLREVQSNCTQGCSGCAMSGDCGAQTSSRIWLLTEAAHNLLERPHPSS